MAKNLTPKEVVGTNKNYNHLPYGGYNCSLMRLYEAPCVVAYNKINILTFILIKGSNGYKPYLILDIDKLECFDIAYKFFINTKGLKIINKEEYSKFLKTAIVCNLCS